MVKKMNKKELAEILKTKINKTTNECIFILTCIEENSYNKETNNRKNTN